jgi:serine/threonine protein kinase
MSPRASLALDGEYETALSRVGLPVTQVGPWAVVGATDRVQGWKLHLSSIPTEAPDLLDVVLPILREGRTSFKVARSAALLGALNEGSLGDLQVGKFLTIYPGSDAEAVALARRVVAVTSDFHGPVVVTDIRLGSVTYGRFGAFRPVITRNRLGQTFPAIHDGTGVLRPDAYSVPFVPPPGVVVPFDFDGFVTDESPDSARKPRLFGPGYLLLETMKANPKGSVFLSLDMRSRREVGLRVLKQGRQHCLSDELGRDIRYRLRRQATLSRLLADVVPIPAAGEYFEVDGHGYLPLDHVPGATLLETIPSVARGCSWAGTSEPERRRVVELLRRLAKIMESMHGAGYVHRDLSPTNVLIGPDLGVHLIDLELAQAMDDRDPPFGKGTPGYMSPEHETRSRAQPGLDVYSFGCLLVLALCGGDPRAVVAGSGTDLVRRLETVSGGAERQLLEITARCLDPVAARRPQMADVARCLALPSAARVHWPTRAPVVRSTLAHTIRAGVSGLLESAPRDADTRLWLSSSDESAPDGREPGPLQLLRDGHHGVAGIVYGLARLVRGGWAEADGIRPEMQRALSWLTHSHGEGDRLPGLYFGDAGVAVALLEAKASGFPVEDSDIRRFFDASVAFPLDWADITHGAAGQGVAAMICEPVLGNLLPVVRTFVDYLTESQQPDGAWRVPPGVEGLSGQVVTGFAHGVAGIVYFLAAAGSRYALAGALDGARRGAAWLIEQATPTAEGGLEWLYSDTVRQRWTWWCHGSPGIALAFMELLRATGDTSYAETAARALDAIGPDVSSPNLSACHGLSGLGEIYLEAARVLEDPRWLQRARAVGNTILAVERPTPGGNSTWFAEDLQTPVADLMVGSAGVLHFLARLHEGPQTQGFPFLLSHGR